MRRISYLAYLCTCLGIGLFMLHLCDLFFIFSLTFIVINHTTLSKQTHLLFVHLLEDFLLFLDDNTLKVCLVFALFFENFSPGLLIKVLLIKKRVIWFLIKSLLYI